MQDLVPILAATCSASSDVYGANFSITPFNAVQYYRSSSFVLSLDGYNNTLPDIEVQDASQNFSVPTETPAALPSGVNQTYFDCLNNTIGSYVGLIDSDYASSATTLRPATAGALAGVLALASLAVSMM